MQLKLRSVSLKIFFSIRKKKFRIYLVIGKDLRRGGGERIAVYIYRFLFATK
jgi:hypothetical protein